MNPQHYMQLALKLAKRASPNPNPKVGCIIVNHGEIVGRGFHRQAGGPHAEVLALQQAKQSAQGATAFVTLEPCCHIGKTPACTKALIEAGIKTVVVACEDPNPLVSGKGIAELKAHGVNVEVGLCAQQALAINKVFFHFITHKKPFVTAKWAMSLDGKTRTAVNDSKDISCSESRKHAHRFRAQVDAILIGANTAREDNPLLTVRHTNKKHKCIQPLRIVLTRDGDLPPALQLFHTTMVAKTLIVTCKQLPATKNQWLSQQGVDVLVLPATDRNEIDLPALMVELAQRGISHLLVEGGMQVLQQFFAENLVNEVQVYLAPTIIADLKQKQPINTMKMQRISRDWHFYTDS